MKYIRGCEVEGLLDPTGRLIDESTVDKHYYDTDFRTYRVWLDANQYAVDTEFCRKQGQESPDIIYDSLNIMVRRKPKENNFKAVLETIRHLMNTKCLVPEWLHDVILGFGDPAAASYKNLSTTLSDLDFFDTFLDEDHLRRSFSSTEVVFETQGQNVPPFRVKFTKGKIMAKSYVIPNRGPYPYEKPKQNSIRFTPTQIEAIKSGMQPGLTLIVGPPGTGKTDVAVQIISNIYHNFPDQRTLIVTHSNQALNQLFEKIMKLDIDERHLLRMGHGQEELDTNQDFSRYGRVNYVLTKRLALLEKVRKLAESLGLPGDAGSTCETASYFFFYHIFSRWEEFMSRVSGHQDAAIVSSSFPFMKFFNDAPQPLFTDGSFDHNLEIAKGCYRHIKKIFTQLDEFKAFELLRSGSDRSKYLLVKEAKIIAMTCTHAALKRIELVNMGFTYDNILMEESAQILEIETFIPLLLQDPIMNPTDNQKNHNRLKRWIMIGDHHQLPPVIKNMAFQKYSNMEQSMFTRLVKLGVPTIDLDAQGRSRPSLCDIFRWRYKNLTDLPHVTECHEYKSANPGFNFDYQIIQVDNFNGVGESEPVPHFYQNLAEAEFIVATFMYMRMIGYPAEKITILTTYNGQKHLLRDVVNQRCANNPFIGRPSKITTVDKFQGQQNDYILLSLVRTKTVGHLRDVRRLVVAMSRARLGLYVFARTAIFNTCYELQPSLNILMARPRELWLLPKEEYASIDRKVPLDQQAPGVQVISSVAQMVEYVFSFYGQKIEEWKVQKPQYITDILEPKKAVTETSEEEEEVQMVTDQEQQEESSGIPTQAMEESEEELGFEPLAEGDTGMDDAEEFQDEEVEEETADDVQE